MPNKDLMKELAELLDDVGGNDSAEKGKANDLNQDEQIALLLKFIEQPLSFAVGDVIRRNEFGKMRYKFPKGSDVAVVVEAYKEPMFEKSGENLTPVHGLIGSVVSGKLGVYSVDFRFYELVKKKAD